MTPGSALTGVILLVGLEAALVGCGSPESCVDGTITAMDRGQVLVETNPHNPSAKDYHLGARPRIRLDAEGGREVVARVERAPSSRRVGDRVRVFYDRGRPEQVRIAGPATGAR
jgi:uncharacterized OB-fold protein